MKCPYNDFSCLYISTCGMSAEKSCTECEQRRDGVRATGAMPGLEAIYHGVKKLIKRKQNGPER